MDITSANSSNNTIRILFLDIDGVLIPYMNDMYKGPILEIERKKDYSDYGYYDPPIDRYSGKFHPNCVTALNYIIEETGCKLILSSTLRSIIGAHERSELEDLKILADNRDIRGEFIGKTGRGSHNRLDECNNWLIEYKRSHPNTIVKSIVLDDEWHHSDAVTNIITDKVFTDGRFGLSMYDADTCIHLFLEPTDLRSSILHPSFEEFYGRVEHMYRNSFNLMKIERNQRNPDFWINKFYLMIETFSRLHDYQFIGFHYPSPVDTISFIIGITYSLAFKIEIGKSYFKETDNRVRLYRMDLKDDDWYYQELSTIKFNRNRVDSILNRVKSKLYDFQEKLRSLEQFKNQ